MSGSKSYEVSILWDAMKQFDKMRWIRIADLEKSPRRAV